MRRLGSFLVALTLGFVLVGTHLEWVQPAAPHAPPCTSCEHSGVVYVDR